jgi:hypothetical protein
MRAARLAVLALSVVAAAVACSDSLAPPTSPLAAGAPSFAKAGKVTICHAAGRAGTTKFVQLSINENALGAHFEDNGTTRAGHEQDTMGACTGPMGTLTLCVTNGTMLGDNLGDVSFSGDIGSVGPVTIPNHGQPAVCSDHLVSAGDVDVTQHSPSNIWLHHVT